LRTWGESELAHRIRCDNRGRLGCGHCVAGDAHGALEIGYEMAPVPIGPELRQDLGALSDPACQTDLGCTVSSRVRERGADTLGPFASVRS